MKTNNKEKLINRLFEDPNLFKGLLFNTKHLAEDDSCLSDETLALILEDSIPEQQFDSVFLHLAWCDICFNVFKLSFKSMENDQTSKAGNFVEKVKNLYDNFSGLNFLIKLLPDNITFNPLNSDFVTISALPYNMVRNEVLPGNTNSVTIEKIIPPYLIDIEIRKIEKDNCDIEIYVRNFESKKPVKKVRIDFSKKERRIYSFVTDKGVVVFNDIDVGKYMITILEESKSVCKFNFLVI